jgi:hypothetical protein
MSNYYFATLAYNLLTIFPKGIRIKQKVVIAWNSEGYTRDLLILPKSN